MGVVGVNLLTNDSLPADTIPQELSTYAYSYPHKSSYRPLTPAVPIAAAWRNENVEQLSLYVHIPFCEMRCGFCNLFTQSQPTEGIVTDYLHTLVRQMGVVRRAVPTATFSQLAIGGGTPTFLSAQQLAKLCTEIETTFGQSIRDLPTSVETSPATATADRLQVLASYGVQRISLGVQSFLPFETRQLGRPQQVDEVHRALNLIQECHFPELNIDLIYGAPEQTLETWLASLGAALDYHPDELYLYPLFVRPQTGLGQQGMRQVEHQVELYIAARELLGDRGYVQTSLRCFRRPSTTSKSTYTCQRDGLIGLGCGARSYTRQLHYATRFATTQAGIRAILREWVMQTDEEFSLATHGIHLSLEEECRRFVIMSLLQAEGLSIAEFQDRFPGTDLHEMPGIDVLIYREWLIANNDRYVLTPLGLQNSDFVGPLLYSPSVLESLRAFVQFPNVPSE